MIGSIHSTNYTSCAVPTHKLEAASSNNTVQPQEIEFSYNPQDETVMDPVTIDLKTEHGKTAKAPRTENVKFVKKERLKPNADGSYVFDKGTPKYAAANSMATVQHTIDSMEKILGYDITFAFGDKQILLDSDAGVDLNAYYSRDEESLNFFHDFDPVKKETVYSGASGEVISHEVGHAVLDAVRPGFLTSWSADTNGLHEAFGDLTALYMSTQNDQVCQLAAQQTGGDLSKPSLLSDTGEHMGRAINNKYNVHTEPRDYVRCMINDCKWEDPSNIDSEEPTPEHPVSTEMHDWSRIFSGAQYDVMAAITKRNMSEGMDAAQAIKAAGQESMELLVGAVKISPTHDASYRDIALAMLKVDARSNEGKAHDIILSTFKERNILEEGDDTPAETMTITAQPRDLTITLDGPEYGKFAGAEVTGKDTSSGAIGIMSDPGDKLAKDMKRLINSGAILYTEPNQVVEKKDLFDKNGNPYMGVVRWTDGKMVIERNKMIS
ncbi:MAG: hypothetical protein ACI38Q_00650 [Candidatus Bruticola sp.]